MNIIEPDISIKNPVDNPRLNTSYQQLKQLIGILNQKALPAKVVTDINREISQINSSTLTGKSLLNLIRTKQSVIIKLIEKEVKLVPRNYYKRLWTALGMTTFGLPMGIAIGLSLDNLALLALGLPIGIAIGAGFGTSLDKKAQKEGRQLDIELK